MIHAKHHHPPHIFQDDTIYFVTARTIDSKLYFDAEEKKETISRCLNSGIQKFNIDLYAWVILSNHYHLLFKIDQGDNLSKFIQSVNGGSSFELNKLEKSRNRKIWYQEWDQCIRNEKDFWKHFNYIHHNPVKHGYMENQEAVIDYKFCSYGQWIKKRGQEWMADCFKEYPIIDFTAKE